MKVQPDLLETMKNSNYSLPQCPSLWYFPEFDPLSTRREGRVDSNNSLEDDEGFDNTDEHFTPQYVDDLAKRLSWFPDPMTHCIGFYCQEKLYQTQQVI